MSGIRRPIQSVLCFFAGHLWTIRKGEPWNSEPGGYDWSRGIISRSDLRRCLRCDRAEWWTRLEFSEWRK